MIIINFCLFAFACSSRSGLVSVYGEDASMSVPMPSQPSATITTSTPKPLKTLQNLTTSISTLRFNHDSQLLAIASNVKKDQMRLVRPTCPLFLSPSLLPISSPLLSRLFKPGSHPSCRCSPSLIPFVFFLSFFAGPSPFAYGVRQLANIENAPRTCHRNRLLARK
jgi:hypothetical protein